MEHSLKRKIRYFLSSHYRGRTEMLVTLQKMRSLGPIVVIGGILRDLILANNKEFRSDLDLVINPQNPDVFREYVMSLGAERNRFGGLCFRATNGRSMFGYYRTPGPTKRDM